ncbi:WD40-repeat-containing domain protein [Pelagophyceae sp. CCMP2097]|nr:WD40-repeat-containing domain protein [Pelagophyceae sp. CCMP2097]
MAAVLDTKHADRIHDVKWDYYSKRLATASSDRTVKVWDVDGETQTLAATLTGHDGPVWEVAWAHPSWGVVLATCSYDGAVLVFRETSPRGEWAVVHHWKAAVDAASVNSIEWAPYEHGSLMLACASSDGHVTILAHSAATDAWATHRFVASPLGCNSISWAPFGASGGARPGGAAESLRIVTGTCDNAVRVWRAENNGAALTWALEPMAHEHVHKDWVRDVAWAPLSGTASTMIASCSEDKTVCIWTQPSPEEPWAPLLMHAFDLPAWRVSWSVTANILAVSTGDDSVTLWKQVLDNQWKQVGTAY